jgi:actin beta/gamma 1
MSNLAPSTTLLADCISQIAQRGLNEEGIFRVNGSASQIKELKRQYRKNRRPDLSKVNIHTVAGLLKSHFKDSQRPLISVELYGDFCAVLQLPADEQALALQTLVRKLNDHNQMTLQTLLLFLNEVTKHADRNSMSPRNLSKMFGPSLLRDARHDARQVMATVNDSIQITELLLEHQEVVFQPPPVTSIRSPRMLPSQASGLGGSGDVANGTGGAFPGIKLRAVVNEPSKSVPALNHSGKTSARGSTTTATQSVAALHDSTATAQQQQQQQAESGDRPPNATAFPGINFHQVESAHQLKGVDAEEGTAAFPGIALHTSEATATESSAAFPGIKMHTAVVKPEALDRIKQLLVEQEERERAERIRRVREREAAEAEAEREAEERERRELAAELAAEERTRTQDQAAREPLLASNFRLVAEEERPVSLVVDAGSYAFRAGFNVGVAPIPQFEFRNSVQSVSGNIDENGLFASYIAGKPKLSFLDAKRGARQHVAELFYPMRDSVVTDWEHHGKVLDHFFHNVYASEESAPEFHNVVFTVSPLSSRQDRERLAELLFETYDVERLYLLTDSVGSLYSAGVRTGLVVESGPDNTRIVPIYHGCVVEQAVTALQGLGGRAVTDYLESKLRAQHSADRQVLKLGTNAYQTLKHELCYVAADYEAECKRVDQHAAHPDRERSPAQAQTQRLHTDEELPAAVCASTSAMELLSPRDELASPHDQPTRYDFGGAVQQPVDVTRVRFKAAEGLFKPSFLGVQSVGLHQGVYNALAKIADPELRSQLCANIVLAGGCTLFPGLAERLQCEVQGVIARSGFASDAGEACAQPPEVRVNGYFDREAASWHGAALLSSTVGFEDTLLGREEFLEVGPNLLHWKMIP